MKRGAPLRAATARPSPMPPAGLALNVSVIGPDEQSGTEIVRVAPGVVE
jgi:hypothetical protein